MLLGERIASLRKKKKLTQQEVSDKLHISRATYAQYEIDRRVPEYLTLEKLADFFEVSIDFLVGREPKDAVDKLIEYLDLEFTNEEIKDRMNFSIDNITLTNEDVDEFIAFVRAKRFMKKQPLASAAKNENS